MTPVWRVDKPRSAVQMEDVDMESNATAYEGGTEAESSSRRREPPSRPSSGAGGSAGGDADTALHRAAGGSPAKAPREFTLPPHRVIKGDPTAPCPLFDCRVSAADGYAWDPLDSMQDVGEAKKHDREIIADCKRRARTDLRRSEWAKYAYARDDSCLVAPKPHGTIAREHASRLSVEDFVTRYEQPNVPVVIDGCCDAWPARKTWSVQELYRRWRHRRFKCGEDDDGYAVKMKLKYFIRYLATQRDDSPLYVFDSGFDDDNKASALLKEYEVPPYFRDDLFRLVGERRRPPYRWFLIGPRRSGTSPHIDPLATSAWNALLRGRKRWVLFPPSTPKSLVKAKGLKRDGEDDEPIDYFNNLLPRLLANAGPDLEYIEFIQYPGETVFVPGGWWHAVLNLDDTIAVTQNFCSRTNFDKVWVSARKGRKRMSVKWLDELTVHYPDLAARARMLNERDNFRMYTPKRKRTESGARESSSSSSSSTSSSDGGGYGGYGTDSGDEVIVSGKHRGRKYDVDRGAAADAPSASTAGGAGGAAAE